MQPEDDVITSIKHPVVAAVRKSLESGGRGDCFVAEGRRMVDQALDAGAPLARVFVLDAAAGEDEAELVRRSHEAGAECHQVTKGVFFKILGLGYETSERVLAIVRRPSWPDAADLLKGNACALIGERIQDPRNVGVLVRTADAFSLPCVVFSADSADAYSRAAVRSTTGSIFRVPLTVAASLPEYLRRLKSRSIRLIGTSANADAPCAEADMSGPCAILLGNESEGLSREARKLCDVVVSIPMSGGAHSFNVTVAAGIALYERQRQNRSS